MTVKAPEDQFSARLNVKCHPEMVTTIRKIAKRSGINNSSVLVRMWLTEAIENELLKDAKAKRSFINI